MLFTLVPALAIGMGSCDDKNINEDYVPTPLTGQVAYFPADISTTFEVKRDATTVEIPVYRAESKGEMTVEIYVTSLDVIENYPYQFAETVTFEDGQKVGYLQVTCNPDEIEYDDEQQYELEIEENYVTPYGLKTEVVTIVYPSPWLELGTGTYLDYMFGLSDTEPYGVETTFYQSEINPNRFRINNPYYPINGEETYFEFQVLQKGMTVDGIEVTMDNLVYFNYMPVTYVDSFEGIVYVVWPGDLGENFASESKWTYNYVNAYQEVEREDSEGNKETVTLPGDIFLSPIYIALETGYWAGDTSSDELVRIIFPGFDASDISIKLSYEGILTTNSGSYVIAQVNMGEDLANVKLAVGKGAQGGSLISAIENGTVETVEITSSGEVRIPFDMANDMGRYVIAAVGYSAEGGVENYTSITFTYSGGGSGSNAGWTTIGNVDYSEGFICALYTTGTFTYSLEIQEKDDTPGYYRLVNPYGPAYPLSAYMEYESNITTYLYIDATNPERIRVLDSPQTIMPDPTYGAITCSDQIDLWMSQGYDEETLYKYGYYGKLTDGKITFAPGTLALYEGNNPDPYQANYLVNSSGTGYETNPSGSYVAPFMVDLGNIRTSLSLSVDGSPATRTAPNYFKMQSPNGMEKSLDGSPYYRLHVKGKR